MLDTKEGDTFNSKTLVKVN